MLTRRKTLSVPLLSPEFGGRTTRAADTMIGDNDEMLGECFAESLKRRRQERGLSVRELGRMASYAKSYISNLEHGVKPPTLDVARRLDSALGAGGELVRLATEMRATGKEESVYRRELLRTMGAAGAGLLSQPLSEIVRRNLMSGLDPNADADDWTATAADYGRVYVESSAADLQRDLLADLSLLDFKIRATSTQAVKAELWRSAGQLSSFLGMTLANLGDTRSALRWYRTARKSADQSGDVKLRMWVRGREAIRTIYEHRPLADLEVMTNEALDIGGQVACAGTAEVYSARAQGFARAGRTSDALTALRHVEQVYARLPEAETRDTATLFGWPAHRLGFIQSHALSYVGQLDKAAQVQDAALAAYPATFARRRAQLYLHRAAGLATVGDVQAAIDTTYEAVGDLPPAHRFRVIVELARDVPRIVAAAGVTTPNTLELDDYLARI